MTAPRALDEPAAPPTVEPDRLHRPRRAIVAVVELLVAGGAVAAAFWAWPRGFATIVTVAGDGTRLLSERTYGNWLGGAIGFGALAALLVLDAIRQLVLAVRVRPRAGGTAAATGTATPRTATPRTATPRTATRQHIDEGGS
ncbi:hypothetical protein [Actinophytocola xanthii]|uniref:Uncharacterized protein n=1 Tax=Actinophytocola xanthii TaxID=1912961 RepID=A0A1Q8CN74_9PSEU|nr:hypothetical protein [Actinophytocola xanthii]OLF15778.1 hypothetical protein BU204_20495 [Actinophytocola xanthii]